MKTVVRLTSLACVLAVGAFGQRGGVVSGRHFGSRTFPSHRIQSPFRFNGGVFLGGPIWPAFHDDDYDNPYPAQAAPNVIVVYAPPAPQPAYYATAPEPAPAPLVKEYHWDNAQTGPAARLPIYFSFALRDTSVVRALAYWVQDDTLHYVDQEGAQKRMPLADIDRSRSAKLNRERGIDFGLPNPE